MCAHHSMLELPLVPLVPAATRLATPVMLTVTVIMPMAVKSTPQIIPPIAEHAAMSALRKTLLPPPVLQELADTLPVTRATPAATVTMPMGVKPTQTPV